MTLRRRRAQSAVETLLVLPLFVLVAVAMYQLWSVAWGAQNAHLRAREYVLHRETYLGSRAGDASGDAPWEGSNYAKAESTTFHFEARSTDTSLAGASRSGQQVEGTAVITSGRR